MTFSTTLFRACIPLFCFALAACGKKGPDGPSSATLDRAALMQVAFPGWAASGSGHKQKLHVPAEESRTNDAKGKPIPEEVDEWVDPAFVVRLSSEEASMIFRASRLDDRGEPETCDSCTKAYGAVQFHRVDGNWYLTNRQDVFIDSAGETSGESAEIVKLSQHAFALKLSIEEGHMGEQNTSVELYELKTDGPHEMLDHILTTAVDGGLEGDCGDVLAKMNKHQPYADADNACWHVETKWLLDAKGETPGDLILHYTGLTRTNNDGKDKQYHYHRIDQQQVLHYQDGKYVHASGADPTDEVRG